MTKAAKCPAKTQISLGIRPVWSVFAVRKVHARDNLTVSDQMSYKVQQDTVSTK